MKTTAKPKHNVRALLAGAALLIGPLTTSCTQTIPPREYNPQVAKHLNRLSHDKPVTPVPASYDGWGYSGYWQSWGPY